MLYTVTCEPGRAEIGTHLSEPTPLQFIAVTSNCALQLYVKRTVHHQLPNLLALWSKATSLSLVRMALSASQKQNRSSGFSNASQTFRCPQSVLAFVEHLDAKHCGFCTTYPGTCGKKRIIGCLSYNMDVLLAIHLTSYLASSYLMTILFCFWSVSDTALSTQQKSQLKC